MLPQNEFVLRPKNVTATIFWCLPEDELRMLAQDLLTLAPFVGQKRRWFSVGRLNPVRKQASLVRLIPQVLVKVGIRYLLQRFNVIHWHKVTIQIHELNTNL